MQVLAEMDLLAAKVLYALPGAMDRVFLNNAT
jgi:hypothetical protein